jgi:hypothetical protein
LDFQGCLAPSGQHIEFEVKETELQHLPVSNIRFSQIDQIEIMEKSGADTFLLVYFINEDEWYRLNAPELKLILDSEMRSIPLEYFRAYGFLVPNDHTWPDYLNPEAHPNANRLREHFRFTKPQRKREVKPLPKIDHTDMESRKQRILKAMSRGVRSAEKKYQQVQFFKDQAIAKKMGQ